MIQPLTQEEIANLEGQHDRILQMLAEIDVAYHNITLELIDTVQILSRAKLDHEIAKSKKAMLTERARNLKTIISKME